VDIPRGLAEESGFKIALMRPYPMDNYLLFYLLDNEFFKHFVASQQVPILNIFFFTVPNYFSVAFFCDT